MMRMCFAAAAALTLVSTTDASASYLKDAIMHADLCDGLEIVPERVATLMEMAATRQASSLATIGESRSRSMPGERSPILEHFLRDKNRGLLIEPCTLALHHYGPEGTRLKGVLRSAARRE